MLTQPQHQPITELSSVASTTFSACLSLFRFILSHPSEGSYTPHASRAEKHKLPNDPAPITEHGRAGPGAANTGQPSIRSC